jgi:pimeloyl-ACP methyl ester carboxylesterase
VPQPKAVVLLVHGYGEWSEYYQNVSLTLNERGFATYAMDHAGHGLSEGERAYVRDVEELAADVLFLAKRLKKRHPELPLLLYGHSMGGAGQFPAFDNWLYGSHAFQFPSWRRRWRPSNRRSCFGQCISRRR